jgi:hypothetical protein
VGAAPHDSTECDANIQHADREQPPPAIAAPHAVNAVLDVGVALGAGLRVRRFFLV